jgi:enamine deaminase RidA (YjgF/YER057c/UK114 family)
MDVYEKLNQLGVTLPELPPRGGIYKPVKQVDRLLYVSGQGATVGGVPSITGKVGSDRTVDEGKQAARLCTLNALSTLQDYLGDLNRIKSVVKILGFVASAPNFNAQPKVIDGASELLRDIWGEDGIAARSAIAANELPGNITTEIEFIFEV